jgi:NAD(P) transhydrogenase subunit beta
MATISTLAYLVASVLFILALRGLSHPETSRRGNLYGMIGMAIAIVASLFHTGMDFGGIVLVLAGLALGGGAGAYLAKQIQMTSLPQLVAAFHSLVGLAAVFVAAAAFYSPESFGIGVRGNIKGASLVEMSLGLAIGAITFSGSVIAFLKLDGRMSGAPLIFPNQHRLNAGLGALLLLLVIVFVLSRLAGAVLADRDPGLRAGLPAHHPDRRRGHAGGGVHAEQLFGWAAAGIGFTIGNLLLIVTARWSAPRAPSCPTSCARG